MGHGLDFWGERQHFFKPLGDKFKTATDGCKVVLMSYGLLEDILTHLPPNDIAEPKYYAGIIDEVRNNDGYGHGAYATVPVTQLVLLQKDIELALTSATASHDMAKIKELTQIVGLLVEARDHVGPEEPDFASQHERILSMKPDYYEEYRAKLHPDLQERYDFKRMERTPSPYPYPVNDF